MINELYPGKLPKKSDQDTIPVVCISAVEGQHLDLPQKYVGLLMTMRHEENHQAIVEKIKNLATNPGEIILH